MKSNWKRNILGGLCLSSVAFVFQACYGTPQDFGSDFLLEGKVISTKTGLPVKGIKISVLDGDYKLPQYDLTDENGNFSFYTLKLESQKIRFEDVDSIENGTFATKDTVIVLSEKQDKVFVEVELDNK